MRVSYSDFRPDVQLDIADSLYERDMCSVSCVKLHPDAKLPKFAYENDGCADLYSVEDKTVLPGSTAIINTGLAMEIPEGWEGLIMSRSGMAAKNGLFVLNAPGVIDAGFRDSLKIILHNTSQAEFKVNAGDRIAQIAIRRVPRISFALVEKLAPSARGNGGLGSTGLK